MTVLHAMTRRGVLRCIAAALFPLRLPLEARRPPCVRNIDGLFFSVDSADHVTQLDPASLRELVARQTVTVAG